MFNGSHKVGILIGFVFVNPSVPNSCDHVARPVKLKLLGSSALYFLNRCLVFPRLNGQFIQFLLDDISPVGKVAVLVL